MLALLLADGSTLVTHVSERVVTLVAVTSKPIWRRPP
jgi:hypothetical protein